MSSLPSSKVRPSKRQKSQDKTNKTGTNGSPSRKRQLVEAELIRVATQCFSQKGYQNTSLEDIVSQVGISRMTFYTYFESKAALLTVLCERSLTDYRHKLEALLAQPLPRPEKLRQAVALHVATLTGDQPLIRLFYREEVQLPAEVSQAVARLHREIDRLLEQEITLGIQQGEIIDENPRLLMYAFTGMGNWLYRWYRPGGKISPDEIVRVFTRVLESGTLTPKTHANNASTTKALQQLEKRLADSLQEVRQELALLSARPPIKN